MYFMHSSYPQVIKSQTQAMEDALAMHAPCDGEDTLLATAALDKALHSYKFSRPYSYAYSAPEDSSKKVPEARSESSESEISADPKGREQVGSSSQVGSVSKDREASAASGGGGANSNGADSNSNSNGSENVKAASAGESGGGANSTEVEGTPVDTAGWLEGTVPLPGGYKTTRRDVLRLLPLAGAMGSFGFLLSRAKVLAPRSTCPLLYTLCTLVLACASVSVLCAHVCAQRVSQNNSQGQHTVENLSTILAEQLRHNEQSTGNQ